MKKYLIILLLLIALPCEARMGAVMMGMGVSGPSCSGSTQQAPTDMVTEASTKGVGQADGSQFQATKFVYTGASGTLCRVDVLLGKNNSPDKTLTVALYENNTTPDPDEPGSALATCGTMATTGLTTTQTWYSFSSCNYASMTNGATYWLVVSVPTADTNNYAKWSIDSTCTTEYILYDANGTGPWTLSSTAYCGTLRLYILE